MLFRSKVQGMYTKQQEELFDIKSQVKSSYDKQDDKHKNIYTVKIIMDTNSQVQQAVCPCPSGNDGRCNHLAATLFAMEDACKKSVSTTSESEDDLPCTSKPCKWSIPKKEKQEPSTVQAVKFVKHVYGKKDKECSSSSTVHTTIVSGGEWLGKPANFKGQGYGSILQRSRDRLHVKVFSRLHPPSQSDHRLVSF